MPNEKPKSIWWKDGHDAQAHGQLTTYVFGKSFIINASEIAFRYAMLKTPKAYGGKMAMMRKLMGG